MRKTLVYDWPTRIFHWSFVVFFISAFAISKIISDKSPNFRLHMLAGLMLGSALVFRIVWGFIGSRHSKFSHFALNPKDLITYFKNLRNKEAKIFAGHNPASSWAGLAMMITVLVVITTGILMGYDKETYSEPHEIFVYLTLALAVAHVSGIIAHTFSRKDPIGLSMIDGKKNVSESEGIQANHWVAGLVLIAIMSAQVVQILSTVDLKEGTVKIWGLKIQLGENEDKD